MATKGGVMPKSNGTDYAAYATISLYAILVSIYFKKITMFMLTLSLGIGCLLYGFELSTAISAGVASLVLFVLIYTMKGKEDSEGFNTRTSASDIAKQITSEKRKFKFSKTIEGYEDVKSEKNEKPAPVKDDSKDNMAIPFKLGEIPSQVKNGPHLDASSTLMKALKSLDPDQINAMSKDTQQLIDTQKSLMNMMGTMKPMLNDGKELMETFQQMFGK
jgi:uncharacterized membrane protein